jgi:hypothetical protein
MREKLKKRNKSLITKTKTSLEFVKDVISLIPNKEDSILSGTIKTLCILGKMIPSTNNDESYASSGFIRQNNKQLVSLIEGLELDLFFAEKEGDNILKSDTLYEMKLFDPEIGTLVLQPTLMDYELVFSSTFFHSPDFDFDKLLDKAWIACDGKLELCSKATQQYGVKNFIYSKFNPIIGKQFGSVKEKIKDFCDKNNAFRKNKLSRSYLFIGPPGCGKSTLAQKFATENYKRILKVDADTLYSVMPTEFISTIGYLKPDCMFVDEIDKQSLFYNNWQTGGNILSLLESVKETFPETTLLFTANKIDPLPEPMIRPGRIDDIIEFEKPNKEDCKAILLGYLDIEIDNVDNIAEQCVGLSPAHIKEIALRFNTGEKDVSELIVRMVKFLKIKAEQANK